LGEEVVNKYRFYEFLIKMFLWIIVVIIFIMRSTAAFSSLPEYLQTLILVLDLSTAVILSGFMPTSMADRKFNKALKLLDKDNDKAVRYLEEYLDSKTLSDNDRQNVLRILGVAHHKRGDDEEAIRCLNLALEGCDKDNNLKVEILGTIGIVCSESGKYQIAAEHFDRAFEIIFATSKAHISKDVLIQVVDTYIKAGQKEKAVRIYDRLMMIRGYKRDKRVEELLDI
jgi:tetratricopeptide (TPR) repeat protein